MRQLTLSNNRLDGIAEISLIGDIEDYNAIEVASLIRNCTSPELRLNINSFGGFVLSAYEILSAMVMYMNAGGIIHTVNNGRADSCAGWIAAAGTKGKRKVMSFASGFFHPPMYSDGTTINDLPEGSPERASLEDTFQKLRNIFTDATGIDDNVIADIMNRNTELNANDLVRYGFADGVNQVNNAPVINAGMKPNDVVNITQEFMNKTQKRVNMSKIANMLGLNPDATEDSVVSEVNRIKSECDSLISEKASMLDKISDLEAKNDALSEKYSKLKDKEAVDYVDGLVKINANLSDDRDALIGMAKQNLSLFKKLNPMDAVVNPDTIDESIVEDKRADEQVAEDARKYANMSVGQRISLKNTDHAEWDKLKNAYIQMS